MDNESSFEQGSRAAFVSVLQTCLIRLGYEDPENKKTSWLLEREAAISSLRDVCEQHGDNDWDEELNLSDIIEKHLYENLEKPAEIKNNHRYYDNTERDNLSLLESFIIMDANENKIGIPAFINSKGWCILANDLPKPLVHYLTKYPILSLDEFISECSKTYLYLTSKGSES